MNRDEIYELLISKILPHLTDKLTCEQITDLDGTLWQIAGTICEKDAVEEAKQ